jgi:hypothetical protein
MKIPWLALALATALASPTLADGLSTTDVQAAVKKATAANDVSFARQLARQQLTKLALPRHASQPARDNARPNLKVGEVTTVDNARVVYLGSFQSCMIDEAEFVQHGSTVYELQRQPKYGPARIESKECYFAGYRCGGAVPPIVALYYELPADATYGGVMPVAYDAQDPNIYNARTDCRPPPPPP